MTKEDHFGTSNPQLADATTVVETQTPKAIVDGMYYFIRLSVF
jgi:hypothetical protein